MKDKDAIICIVITIAFIFAIMVMQSIVREPSNNSPVEESNVVDSLTTLNDSIKINVKHLDSTKNAKVIEVRSLDNDSSIKLFYKLVSD